MAEESRALAGISSASIQGRIALGRRAGARVCVVYVIDTTNGKVKTIPVVTSRTG